MTLLSGNEVLASLAGTWIGDEQIATTRWGQGGSATASIRAQFALNDVWRLGFAAGYQSSNLNSANGATGEGEQAQAGIALKYNSGPLLLAGALTGGRVWTDTTRSLNFGGGARWFIKPRLAFSVDLRAHRMVGGDATPPVSVFAVGAGLSIR